MIVKRLEQRIQVLLYINKVISIIIIIIIIIITIISQHTT